MFNFTRDERVQFNPRQANYRLSNLRFNPYVGTFHRLDSHNGTEDASSKLVLTEAKNNPLVGNFRHSPAGEGSSRTLGLKSILYGSQGKTAPILSQLHVSRGVSAPTDRNILESLRSIPVSTYAFPPISPEHDQDCVQDRDRDHSEDAGLSRGRISSRASFMSMDSDNRPVCSICLVPYCDGDEIATLACSHCFHRSCAGKWFLQGCVNRSTGGALSTLNCPQCRQDLVQVEANPSSLSSPFMDREQGTAERTAGRAETELAETGPAALTAETSSGHSRRDRPAAAEGSGDDGCSIRSKSSRSSSSSGAGSQCEHLRLSLLTLGDALAGDAFAGGVYDFLSDFGSERSSYSNISSQKAQLQSQSQRSTKKAHRSPRSTARSVSSRESRANVRSAATVVAEQPCLLSTEAVAAAENALGSFSPAAAVVPRETGSKTTAQVDAAASSREETSSRATAENVHSVENFLSAPATAPAIACAPIATATNAIVPAGRRPQQISDSHQQESNDTNRHYEDKESDQGSMDSDSKDNNNGGVDVSCDLIRVSQSNIPHVGLECSLGDSCYSDCGRPVDLSRPTPLSTLPTFRTIDK